ncbi:MAG: lysostaphin resistance A-like protein [Phycisphaerales bacterium]
MARPRLWTAWCVVVLALAAALGGAVLGFLAYLPFSGEISNLTGPSPAGSQEVVERIATQPGAVIATVVGSQLGFLGVSILAAVLSPVPWRRRLGLVPSSLPLWAYPLAALGTLFIPSILEAILWTFVFDEPSEHLRELAKALAGGSTGTGVAIVLAASVLPGVCEEILVRGYFQTRLHQRHAPWLAILISSIVFGLMHIDPQHAIAAGCLGAWLGWLRRATGSVYPSIFCHFFNNALGIILMRTLGAEESLETTSSFEHPVWWISVAISGVCLAATVVVLARAKRATASV